MLALLWKHEPMTPSTGAAVRLTGMLSAIERITVRL
jgi:hypothetical protein